jgi:hypothetical protein
VAQRLRSVEMGKMGMMWRGEGMNRHEQQRESIAAAANGAIVAPGRRPAQALNGNSLDRRLRPP